MSTKEAGAGVVAAAMLSSPGGAVLVPAVIAVMLAVSIMVALSRIDELDEKEPPLMKSSIPYCGHLLGMLKWQVGYMQMLSSKVPSYSAFTLRVFSNRIYVICDPSLIQAAYRNTKAFDFGQFVVESSQRAFDIGDQGMKIIRGETAPGYDPNGKYLNGNDGDSFLNENHRVMVESLSPGTGLSELNKGVLEKVAGFLNVIDGDGETFGLYRWIRDVLTLATADALYGSKSPLNSDSSLIDALWDFEENMTLLMLNFLPTFLAPKAYKGRLAIKSAFTTYYAENHHLGASKLIRSRLESCQRWGFSSNDIANFEISTLFLATTNSIPTSFWQLSYILSFPSLLSEIRTEVESIVTRKTNAETGEEEAIMDISHFQTHCPLLLSTFHETLRLVDAATSVRAVTQPTTLTSSTSPQTYHLKSPSVIQLPSGITHTSTQIWGPTASEFDPTRFLPGTKARLSKDTRRAQAAAYFPFGGGKHLCPGRHFAMMEILAFIALIVVGFDVCGKEGDGLGLDKVPERAFQKLGTAVRKPVRDVDVRVKRRKGWEGINWRFGEGNGGEVDFGGLVGEGEVESEESE